MMRTQALMRALPQISDLALRRAAAGPRPRRFFVPFREKGIVRSDGSQGLARLAQVSSCPSGNALLCLVCRPEAVWARVQTNQHMHTFGYCLRVCVRIGMHHERLCASPGRCEMYMWQASKHACMCICLHAFVHGHWHASRVLSSGRWRTRELRCGSTLNLRPS